MGIPRAGATSTKGAGGTKTQAKPPATKTPKSKQTKQQTPKTQKELRLDKINSTMSTTEAQEFEKLVRSRPEIESAYSKYGDRVSSITRSNNGGVFRRSNKSVEFSFSKYPEIDKYSTLSHEMGHAIDYFSSADLPVSYSEVDLVNRKTAGLIKRSPSTSDEFLVAMRKDATALEQALKDPNIVRELNADNASSGIQDFADGLFGTQDKGVLRWGHGNKYYNRLYNKGVKAYGMEDDLIDAYEELGKGRLTKTKAKAMMRQYDTASELWANGMSALTVGGKELEYMQKYAPNTLDAILNILGGIK